MSLAYFQNFAIFFCLFFIIKIRNRQNTMENLEKRVNQSHLGLLITKVSLMSSCEFEVQSTGSGVSFGSAFMPQLVV